MNSFDRRIYESCKNRYCPDGVHNPTDVETILCMAKEVDKLRADTKALQTDITLLKIEKYSDVFEKTKRGKTVEFEFNGISHKLMVTKVTEEIGGAVILEGKWVK